MIWLLIVVLGLGIFLYALISRPKIRPSGRSHPQPNLNRAEAGERWRKIEDSANRGEHGLKSAIADADKLLDQVLRQSGFTGETMAERLKRAESRLSDKEAVWQAHKIRNAIAHEVNYDLLTSRGREAISAFRGALKDLGAL